MMSVVISVVQAQCVVAVARLGSFRKAAAALYMAQPAVSANVLKAERTLNIELFERTSTGATLTPHGVALLPHFDALLTSHDSVMSKSAEIKSGEAPILRIASHRMGQVILLPPALHTLRESIGGALAVDITHADDVRTSELVRSGQVELGLGIRALGSVNEDPLLHEVVIGTAPIVIYCAADHPFAGLTAVSTEAVAAETIVSGRSAAGEQLFAIHLGRFNDISRVLVDDAQVALQMVSDGVGVAALVSGLDAMVPNTAVVAVPLEVDIAVSSTLMKRSGEHLSVAAAALWQLLAPGLPLR